ncbi:MAG: helix-hairpin-helix domain-containing protein [Acidobacteria bacterium]|nr:helix-hairpin-helix domain-containing protein [Acidobacteriota bacterium]
MLEFRPRETVALAVLGGLILSGALVAFARARPAALGAAAVPAVAPSAAPSASAAAGERIVVHVAGAVRRPGVYEFAPGARVIDAVRRAGGPAPGADVDSINLARPLADGERIYVPRRGEVPPNGAAADGGGSGGAASGGKLNINAASERDLEGLPGVGPVLAQRIVEYRTQHGPFRSVRDLLKVEGIGEKKFSSLEPYVTV